MVRKDCDCSKRETKLSTERIDTLLRTIANRYRRQILRHAVSADKDVINHEDVVDYLIDCNPELEENDRKRLRTKLHHVALPRLADAGLIDYDQRSQTIRYCGDPFIEKQISVIEEFEFD